MITVICVVAVVFLLFVLWLKAKTGAKKTPEQRTAFESILVTLFVMHRKNMEEAAETLRTAEVSREEGIQKCKDAMRDLNESFQRELQAIYLNKSNLKDKVLPDLKKKPGYYNGKALEYKKKYEEYTEQANAADARNPEKLREAANKYKSQACKCLAFKQRSLDRIGKAEDYLQDIDITIDETKMTYDGHKMELDELRQELEMMLGNISTAKFNESIGLIRSIKDETAGKLRAQNARIEAESWIQGQQAEAESSVSTMEFTDEFDKL